ncbi:DUF481 domain-containing protein [Oceaniserpentilla sp. 4NH20-0058]|uniref:DUF481 domain-containing protein n=1 Tax=Oceaniserpentilla sp. 4NH20-0058 TaxID=3127660 RepID=UPI003108EE6B
MSVTKILTAASLLAASQLTLAAEPITGEAELGFVSTTGNTETTSVKAKVSVTQDLDNWKNTYLLDTLFKEEEVVINGNKQNQTSAERYFASAQGDYKLNEDHSALFVYGSYEDDRFSGYEYQSSIAAGYADQMFSDETSFLNYNVGPGYFFSEQNDGETTDGAILRLALDYQLSLSETAKFKQALSSEIAFESEDNTKTRSETSISASLMGNLSIKASYNIIHNTEVPAGNDDVDTTTSVSVLYIF